jgi:hypothetical protein
MTEANERIQSFEKNHISTGEYRPAPSDLAKKAASG